MKLISFREYKQIDSNAYCSATITKDEQKLQEISFILVEMIHD